MFLAQKMTRVPIFMKFGASFKIKYWLADCHLHMTGDQPVDTGGMAGLEFVVKCVKDYFSN